MDRILAGWGAMAAFQIRDFETANRFLGIMEAEPGPRSPLALSLRTFIATCEALYRQESEKAAVHSKECLRRLEESGNTSYLPTTHLLVAHASRALHDHGEAARHLAQARRIGAEIESNLAVWLSALTEAYFCIDGNDTFGAIESIDASGLVAAPLFTQGLESGQEVALPNWTAAQRNAWTLEVGQAGRVALLRPLAGGRYRVERVITPVVALDGR